MAQLGSGNSSSYPVTIDTRQTFVNAPTSAPDSNTRIDSELVNDTLAAIINLETTLGANVQGDFGSVAARLQQFAPGGGSTPALFPFISRTSVIIPGTTHRLGSATLLVQVYDNQIPANAIVPEEVKIDRYTYDVTVTFATPTSGTVTLAVLTPQYTLAFTAATAVTILGTEHQMDTAALLVKLFDAGDPVWNLMIPADVTIDPVTFDVTVTFALPTSGSLILSGAGPRSVVTFTNQTALLITGTTHGLASKALLFQVYDNGNPVRLIEPMGLTVDPGTFDVTVTFAVPQSGALLLVRVSDISGKDFDLRDTGVTDSTATRVYSSAGLLNLQMGSGDATVFRNRLGQVLMTLAHAGNLGIGTHAPAHQLHLSTDDAAKLATSVWTITSDPRLKEVLGPFVDGLAALLQFEPVRFKYNGKGGIPRDNKEHVGILADAVQQIAPYMVSTRRGQIDVGGEMTAILEYNGHAMTFILINAIKELAAANTDLTARVVALETARATQHGGAPDAPPT